VRLLARAPGKVNLCLLLGGVRADGRHELVTVFESVSLCDELELSVLGAEAGTDVVVCPGVDGPNLVTAAVEGLRSQGWDGPRVRIEVRKQIPVAGGMGGGSADAAAALRLADAVRAAPDGAVAAVAATLGADVAGQLSPGVAIGTGAGEVVESVAALTPHAFAVVPLPFGLPTADVYREADRLGLPRPAGELHAVLGVLRASLSGPVGSLPADVAVNDLERAALSLRPEIQRALVDVRSAGADRALVSGSGPTVLGLLDGDDAATRATAVVAALAGRYPGACAAHPVDDGFGQPSPRSGTIC
jgi:4-diphosphocytidyl-2-C-methyl-D-erythritol kinase